MTLPDNVIAEVINQGREKKVEHPVKEQSRWLANKVMTGEGVVLQRITLSKEAFEENKVKYSYISKEKKFLSFVSQEESQEGECSIDAWETFAPIDTYEESTAKFSPKFPKKLKMRNACR